MQGIDIPDIQLVVQYQLPTSFCVLWQRLGRAARNILLKGMGIVIVEAKHFDDEKAKRQKAAEARMIKQRKRKHDALIKEELDSTRSRSCSPEPNNTDSRPMSRDTSPAPSISDSESAGSTSFGSTSRSFISSRPAGVRGRKTKPTGRANSRTIEAGLDQFINSQSPGHVKKRSRRQAVNSYFRNPTEGQWHLSLSSEFVQVDTD